MNSKKAVQNMGYNERIVETQFAMVLIEESDRKKRYLRLTKVLVDVLSES